MSDVEFKVGASTAAADAALDKLADKAMTTGQKMQSAMREASYKMASGFKESFEKINGEFGKVIDSAKKMQGALLAVGAVLAGGKAFKATIDETVQMTKEATALSRALGITVTQASYLNIALDDIYQSSETLLAGNAKLTKQLNADEDAFKKLGVATRDQTGNFRNSLDIMLDVNTRLSQFKEGTDRNIEATKIYGKGFQDMLPLIKLTADRMAEAKEKAADLGLTIGVEGVERVSQYRAAMNDVGDVLSAVKKTIGDALMPVLTQLGNWFASIGPAMVTIFKGAIGGLVSVFHGLTLSFKIAYELISLGFKNMINAGSTFGKVMWAVLKGDFAGAAEAAKAGFKTMQVNASDAFNNIVADATMTQEKLRQLFSQDTVIATPASSGKTSEGGGNSTTKKAESRTGMWDAQLAEMRDAFEKQKLEQGSFEEFGKARERDYWKNILDTVKLSTAEKQAVSAKYYALERDLRKGAFEAEMQALKNQQAALAEGSAARIEKAEEIARKVGDKYGLESKEYAAAMADIRAMAVAHQKQMDALSELALTRTRAIKQSEIDLERVRIEESAALGEISGTKKLEMLAQLKEQEFQLELQSAMDRAALVENDVIAYQQAQDRILEIKRKHELDKANIEKEIKVSNKKDFDDKVSPFEKAFEKSINGIIAGTQTLRGAMKSLAQSVALEFSNMGVKMLVQWAANQLRMTMATATGTAARGAIETAGAAKSMALGGATAFKSIMNSAYETMASAYKAIAGIPFIGPFLAPVVAAGAFTAVAGLAGSVASAEGGYDIPAGLNPMTQLHEKEMVLPEKYAETIRGLSNGEGGGGVTNVHINALDAKSVTEMFRNNPNILAPALRRAQRNYSPTSQNKSPMGRF